MENNNRTPEEGLPGNNNEMIFDNEKNGQDVKKANYADDIFVGENVPLRKSSKKFGKKSPKRSLFMEYVHGWYVFIITGLVCIPAYMVEIFLGSLFVAKNVPPMAAALLSMFLGGFIATFPLLIYNIYLIVKKKKYYAIAVQIIAIELLGLLFYLYSKIAFAWA